MHQNLLEGLLNKKAQVAGPSPRYSHSVTRGSRLRICISDDARDEDPVCPGIPIENCCSRIQLVAVSSYRQT